MLQVLAVSNEKIAANETDREKTALSIHRSL